MKRISTAAIAAATALSLVAAPAFAQENTETKTTTTTTETTTTTTDGEGNTKTETTTTTEKVEEPVGDQKEDEKSAENEQPADDNKNTQPPAKNNQQPSNNKDNGSSANVGSAVGTITGILAAVLTTGLIVFADPRGLNKIIDALNANFALGIPHVNVPKVQLPF